MNSKSRFVIVGLVAALALPVATFAAKGDKKKDKAAAANQPSYASLDKDGDQAVTEAEYIAATKDNLGEVGAKNRFAMLDKNHDGKLTQEEYNAAPSEKKPRKKKNAN